MFASPTNYFVRNTLAKTVRRFYSTSFKPGPRCIPQGFRTMHVSFVSPRHGLMRRMVSPPGRSNTRGCQSIRKRSLGAFSWVWLKNHGWCCWQRKFAENPVSANGCCQIWLVTTWRWITAQMVEQELCDIHWSLMRNDGHQTVSNVLRCNALQAKVFIAHITLDIHLTVFHRDRTSIQEDLLFWFITLQLTLTLDFLRGGMSKLMIDCVKGAMCHLQLPLKRQATKAWLVLSQSTIAFSSRHFPNGCLIYFTECLLPTGCPEPGCNAQAF